MAPSTNCKLKVPQHGPINGSRRLTEHEILGKFLKYRDYPEGIFNSIVRIPKLNRLYPILDVSRELTRQGSSRLD